MISNLQGPDLPVVNSLSHLSVLLHRYEMLNHRKQVAASVTFQEEAWHNLQIIPS